ncbi:ubiquitin-related modifier 1 isoform X3 [Prionailurus bengalensis]|uniref:ubiquitin-related modifier 1 isoform X3 n=1 Tax=Prionailurus bengalensis TaxID=37029 RepID=UPI001CA9CCC5|nr:ubiquitin-related modifier 1 isoform X3 [Prionailurus bengalensis]
MPGKSVPGKGSLAPEVLLDQALLSSRNWVGSHFVPETAPAVPSASRAEGTPSCSAQLRPSSGEPPGSSTLAPGLVQAMPRREVAVPGGIGAEAVAFSALALCLLLCDVLDRDTEM